MKVQDKYLKLISKRRTNGRSLDGGKSWDGSATYFVTM